MSKYLFRGQTCVYCLREASTPTGDHVFARKFFLVSQRDQLLKVPACLSCGNIKSRLEGYLTAVLPFGGMHPTAAQTLRDAEGRLTKNSRLRRELATQSSTVWSEVLPGISVPMSAVPFDSLRLHDWFAFVARGLMWHHWQIA